LMTPFQSARGAMHDHFVVRGYYSTVERPPGSPQRLGDLLPLDKSEGSRMAGTLEGALGDWPAAVAGGGGYVLSACHQDGAA
jgi:hypothetical protein